MRKAFKTRFKGRLNDRFRPCSPDERGLEQLSVATRHTTRLRVERTFTWEDTFKRLLLRFERLQQRHYGMKLLGYTLINLRTFCGI